jgi:uncharacterized protein (TIGR03435 family)
MTKGIVSAAVLCCPCAVVLSLPAALATAAQEPPQGKIAFEVASIRASAPGAKLTYTRNPSDVFFTNVTLKRLAEIAYQVRDFGFSGPEWMDTLHFDVSAKIPQGATREQYPDMLKSLLVERFKMAVHRQTKLLPGYALVAAKGGFKLQPLESNGPSGDSSEGRLVAEGFTMDFLSQWLTRELNQPVADKTGIAGRYNFALDYSEDSLKPIAPGKPVDDSRPSIFSALQQTLGLKLMPEKLPVEILIVDHIERAPSEN